MRSGKIRKEHPNPQKRKKCCCDVDVGNASSPLPSASVISAAPFSPTADPPSSETLKSQLAAVLTPYPHPLKPCKSSLLSYFKKKPKLELSTNGGEIKSEPGQSALMKPAVTDPSSIVCGHLTTVAQVYCPASPASPVFPQLASQSEASHSPSLEDQWAVPSSKLELSQITISGDVSLVEGEGVPPSVASPAAPHQLAGPAGPSAGCHDPLQDHGSFLPSSPPGSPMDPEFNGWHPFNVTIKVF
ncbi:hypothetical protein NDU88_005789 [Pleurodeles waltl]|uniref:Uncharacterized protein n=1 Tax=Pleurodeles waltl TaxID=8319 RepID=A0AAV7TBP9_PLEWA|nr:hypothetical protein NDU88_005789 [Pleurodeles waltl]